MVISFQNNTGLSFAIFLPYYSTFTFYTHCAVSCGYFTFYIYGGFLLIGIISDAEFKRIPVPTLRRHGCFNALSYCTISF